MANRETRRRNPATRTQQGQAADGVDRGRQGYSVGTDGRRPRSHAGAVSSRTAPDRRVLFGALAFLVVAAAVIAAVLLTRGGDGGGRKGTASLPGMQTDRPADGLWPPEPTQLADRVEALGLPPLAANESLAFHIHQHLDIFVNGKRFVVPEGIGLGNGGGIAVLHTHDTRGVLHVESPTERAYTLGDFFGVWGVRLANGCIGGYCPSGNRTLRAFVNGRPVTGDPAAIRLASHQEIVLAYGTDAQVRANVPRSFTFQSGE